MALTTLELTWAQFNELRLLCEAVNHSKSAGAEVGQLQNTIVDAEWTANAVEITLDI